MQFDGFHGTDDMISSPYSEAVNIEFIEVCSEESEDMDRCEEGNLREKKNILKKEEKLSQCWLLRTMRSKNTLKSQEITLL